MAQLLVRRVDASLVRALKRRAAAKARSAEAEHREILERALTTRPRGATFKEALLEMPNAGRDADFERSRDVGRRVHL